MPARVVPIISKYGPYIRGGYEFLKDMGLFSRDSSSVKKAIDNINRQIQEINGRLSELSIRIDQVRDDLMLLIQETEYHRIADDVLSTNSVFRRYLEVGDRVGIARLLPLSDREERNLKRKLGADHGFSGDQYAAYFNLYLIHSQSKFIIQSAADNVTAKSYIEKVDGVRVDINKYFKRCFEEIVMSERQKYQVAYIRIEGPPQDNSRDPVVGPTYRIMGYSYDGGDPVAVTSYELRSGAVNLVSEGNEEREHAALDRIDKKINEMVEKHARQVCAPYQEIAEAMA